MKELSQYGHDLDCQTVYDRRCYDGDDPAIEHPHGAILQFARQMFSAAPSGLAPPDRRNPCTWESPKFPLAQARQSVWSVLCSHGQSGAENAGK